MNDWTSGRNGNSNGVISYDEIKFYIGNTQAVCYATTGQHSISIAKNSSNRLFSIGALKGYYGVLDPDTRYTTSASSVSFNDDLAYDVVLTAFDEVTPAQVLAIDNSEFRCVNVEKVKELAKAVIDYRVGISTKQTEDLPALVTVNDLTFDKEQVIEEMISKVDKKAFTSAYASYLRDYKSANELTDRYLRKWAEAKYKIYLMLGRNLQITDEFEYELDKGELYDLCQEKLNQFTLGSLIANNIDENYCNQNMREFTISRHDDIHRFVGDKKVSLGGYLNMLGLDDKNPIKKEIDATLGSSRTVGTCHISLDPIAYIMQSMNKNKWSSCHGWRGCHHKSVVAYAFDEYSIVSFMTTNGDMVEYKKGECLQDGDDNDSEIISAFKWYSMKTRMMIYVHANTATFQTSRLYPQGKEWELLEAFIRRMFEKKVSESLGMEDKWAINRKANMCVNAVNVYNDSSSGYNCNTIKHKYYTGSKPEFTIGCDSSTINEYTR